ncbi:MAG TPA: PfkB family carbohydrate kinase [Methylomirabilota bacterium]|nr:PfkB family carbohydrate kinase [Methylomirabilota bacterium]
MIVVAGEALIDLIAGRDGTVVGVPGGGPYNTARAIARLGQPVTFLGRISTDRFGRDLRAALAGDGVAPDGLVETDDPTTLAVVEVDGDGAAQYRFYVEGTSAPGLTEADVARVRSGSATALHIGTLGLVLEPIGTTLERLVKRSDASQLVMLDPNCRPSATTDPAAFRARIERIAARADVVKVSDDDVRFLAPDRDPDAAIEALLGLGTRVVLRTRGDDDVEIRMASGRATVPVPAVQVIDTVGAGDAFNGGFLAEWTSAGHGRDELGSMDLVRDAVRTAVAVAALSCTRPGADPPTRAELEAFSA